VNPEVEPREIAAGIWWIPECLSAVRGGVLSHAHVAPYVVVGPERSLIFDTAPPSHWARLQKNLDLILGGRPLDYVVASHPEVPHCGNFARLLERYPDAVAVGDVRDYHLYFPHLADRLVTMPPGSTLELGGDRRFVLLDAPLHDLPGSQWGYETAEQVLFVADAFAVIHHLTPPDVELPIHAPDECTLMSSEIGKPPTMEQITWINERALFWMRYTAVDPHLKRVEEMLHMYPTRLIAPAHGAVIDDVDVALPVIWEAYRLCTLQIGAEAQS
jgi:flavorubredoxin